MQLRQEIMIQEWLKRHAGEAAEWFRRKKKQTDRQKDGRTRWYGDDEHHLEEQLTSPRSAGRLH